MQIMIKKLLNNTLGIKCKIQHFNKKLPAFLSDNRTYEILIIEDQKFILVEYEQGIFKLPQAKKQLKALAKYCDYPPIVVLPSITGYQRKALIEQRIDFIVPDSQIYLPELGMLLGQTRQTRQTDPKHKKPRGTLSGSAQLILIAYILGLLANQSTQKDIAQALNLNDMAVSRAIRELVALGLVTIKRQGTSTLVNPALTGRALFEVAQTAMKSPSKRSQFIRAEDLPKDAILSGDSALAEQTMLADPPYPTYALTKKDYKTADQIDPDWTINEDVVLVEEWAFDPKITAHDGMIDAISLILAMGDTEDERTEMAIDELEEQVFGERA